jgi:hypothetical protein
VQLYAAVVTPVADGLRVSPNQVVSAGTSNAPASDNGIELGDYTGLDFVGGVLHPLWADNSNSTGDNPGGVRHTLDMYTASVPASSFADAAAVSLGGLAEATGPVASLYLRGDTSRTSLTSGVNYIFRVSYSPGTDVSTFGDTNVPVTGPNGFSASAHYARSRTLRDGTVLATYHVDPPNPHWRVDDDGTYTISLQPDQVRDTAGAAAASGILGHFAVAVGTRQKGPFGLPLPPDLPLPAGFPIPPFLKQRHLPSKETD